MNIQEKLANLREQQSAFAKAKTALDASLKETEAELRAIMDRLLKRYKLDRIVSIYLCFTGGCHVDGWDPFYSVSDVRSDLRGGFICVGEKWVYTTKVGAHEVYVHNLDFKKVLDPKVVTTLAAFKADLEKESGLRVEIRNRKIVSKGDIEVPQSEDDLLTVHDGGKIVAKGAIAHKGWDIRDPWAVVKTRKGHLVVYYSTNGHGFGYDQCIMPEQPLDRFYEWIGADIDGLTQALLSASRAG